MDRTLMKVIAVACVILFFGALFFLVSVLRSRFGEPLTDADNGDTGEDEDDEYEDDEEDEEEEDDGAASGGEEESRPEEETEADAERSSFAPPEPDEPEDGDADAEESDVGLEGDDLESLFTELFEGRSEEETEEEEPEDEEPAAGAVHLNNMLDSAHMFGKTPEECGVPASCLSEDGTEILTEGNLFGEYSYGGVKLEDSRGVSFYVICHGMDFETCRTELSKLYGKAFTSGEQAYREDEMSVYCAWETGYGVLWLSHTGEREFINLNATLS